MTSITAVLAQILTTAQRPGSFCTSGTAEIFVPRLVVEGVGPVALPLLPAQAEQLVAVAEQAPYGRGPDTIIDTGVRRTWQIGAEAVRIEGQRWPEALAAIVARATESLGVNDPVVAEFYKLLVYDAGGFFTSHRDTEKAAGMFATLVIVLPSVYSGGELIVRHQDQEVRIDLCRSDPSEVAFAAFYADCRHEVRPVASGWRLTLVYNLLRKGRRGPLPKPPQYATEQTRIAHLLRAWPEDGPEKLIYPLEHAYTAAGLSFAALKGADAARASVLTAAAAEAACDLHLALVSIEESGGAEYLGDYTSSRRGRGDSEDDFEVGEVYERATSLSHWHRPDGTPSAMGPMPFDETELSPPDALDDIEPDELEFTEATGNAGASFERTYRRAALVLWPTARRLTVLAEAGLEVSLPALSDLVQRWQASGTDRTTPLWAEAHALADEVLASWPRERRLPSQRDEPGDAATMLALLDRLGDAAPLDAFLADLSAAGVYAKGDNEAILQALSHLPSDRASELIGRIVAGNGARTPRGCANLLVRATALGTVDLRAAAKVLLEALPPGKTPRPDEDWEPDDDWDIDDCFQPSPAVKPDLVVDVVTALARIGPDLAEQAVDHMLAQPAVYDLDAALVPAALSLVGQSAAAMDRIRAACRVHLRARIALPLDPPGDWVRPSALTCGCADCTALGTFLADASRPTWTFKAAEARRRHMAQTIRRSGCDLETATERRGSPYGLVCTKTQASYDRRTRQREQDVTALARLEEK